MSANNGNPKESDMTRSRESSMMIGVLVIYVVGIAMGLFAGFVFWHGL